MAETTVSSLIDRLLHLLTQEAKLLGGIHGEVADIKDELESIQSFLKDADAKAAAEQDIDEGVKTWVKQVREVAFHIDVAIDQYLLQVALHDPHPSGFRAKIQEIKASVQKINERSKRYGFQSTAQGSCCGARSISWNNDPRKDSLYLDDADVVGIESSIDELISGLVGGSPHRTVVSVVGMGGLGKTTLTKKIYDNQMVRGHFDCHAWISVSQSYKIEDLLRSIIKQFCESRRELPLLGIDAMDEQLLVNKLRDYLLQKRYVVVYDDVWKIEFWDSIKNSLPNNHIGGRIIITTCNSEVANYCKKSSPIRVYKLQPLPCDKAWELFCKRAFQFDFEGHCPASLEKLSHDIVEKCGGLPLAIVAISGLLSTKDKTMFEWKNLHDSLGFEFGRNPHLSSVNKILSLSFEYLPYNLKSCFLYLGMYPEDYSINCIRLVRQWIAEGFVKEIEGKTLEEVAQEYLIELIHRSLVQASEVNLDGKVRRCRLHDLLHEIVLQKMKDLSFCHVLLKQESSFEGLIQRMSVNKVSYNVLKGFKDKKVHSLLLFNLDELPKSFMSPFFFFQISSF
ncbi:disease resistance protein RPM1-like [Quercus suber]|uniref:disease resistance protein RPM1-like n=1 Tax=Quercus suber TaxID=58331 RepID=UPI0032DFAB73